MEQRLTVGPGGTILDYYKMSPGIHDDSDIQVKSVPDNTHTVT